MNKRKRDLIIYMIIALAIILISVVIITNWSNLSVFFSSMNGDVLSFYHWWTSPGERAALNALTNIFIDKYPEIIVLPSSLISKSSAGGGVELFNVLKPILQSGEAPDVFQTHAGYETRIYYKANLLGNVDSVWEKNNLEEVVPEIVQVMCKFDDGHYYSVPVDIHRANIVWYNKKILDENNIDPLKLMNWSSFFDACEKIKKSGVDYPIQLGTSWTAQHVFDQIIASEGIAFYENWINGKLAENDTKLLNSLETFKRYLSYTNPDSADIEWNTATNRIIHGEGAFNIMGDWANGEFKAAGMEYNKDYGTFLVPRTKNMYGLVIDTFSIPKKPQHPESAEKWLEVAGSKEGQDAFNPLKGSISARTDTDVSKYDKYQQTAIFDFITAQYMYPAVSNGAPKSFEIMEQQIIANFVRDKDVNKAAKAFTDYQKEIHNEYEITWELD